MTTDLDEKQLRAKQYWYIDGTYEFNMAGIFLLLTLYFLALAKYEGTKFGAFLSVIIVLVFLGGMFGVSWLIRQLKNRVTFPRTGYVAYQREKKGKRKKRLVWVAGFSGTLSVLIIMAINNVSTPLNWIPGMVGLAMAIASSIFGVRMRIMRFYWIAALSVVIGTAIMFVSADMNMGLALYYGIMGVALLVIGGFVLSTYLRSTTPPEEGEHE